MHSRAPAVKTKNPLDDSARIARGLGGSCRVHKPGVPRGLASTPRLGPSRQHVTHGPAQESKNNRPEGRSNHRPEGLAEEEQRPLVGYFGPPLQPERSLRLQPPPDGLSDRKAWPKTLLPTPTPRLRPGTRRKPAYRSSPTGTASTDWSHPIGDQNVLPSYHVLDSWAGP